MPLEIGWQSVSYGKTTDTQTAISIPDNVWNTNGEFFYENNAQGNLFSHQGGFFTQNGNTMRRTSTSWMELNSDGNGYAYFNLTFRMTQTTLYTSLMGQWIAGSNENITGWSPWNTFVKITLLFKLITI